MPRPFALPAIAITLGLALVACGGGGGGGNDGGGTTLKPTWTSIQQNVIPGCSLSNACHLNTAHPTGHIVITQSTAYANLVGVASTEVPNVQLIKPGDPDNSYVVNKLEGTQQSVCSANGLSDFTCGVQMPSGGPYKSAADMKVIRQWITDGALEN